MYITVQLTKEDIICSDREISLENIRNLDSQLIGRADYIVYNDPEKTIMLKHRYGRIKTAPHKKIEIKNNKKINKGKNQFNLRNA